MLMMTMTPHLMTMTLHLISKIFKNEIKNTGVRQPATPPHPPRREGRPESKEEGAAHQETSQCIHALYEGERGRMVAIRSRCYSMKICVLCIAIIIRRCGRWCRLSARWRSQPPSTRSLEDGWASSWGGGGHQHDDDDDDDDDDDEIKSMEITFFFNLKYYSGTD